MNANPYSKLPQRAFWRTAIADRNFHDLTEIWDGMPLAKADSIATAGSCFAQHIGRHLAMRGANFMDCEPPPPSLFASPAEARRFGYSLYSCRYGNVYTSRQLIQLFQQAFDERRVEDGVWFNGNRAFDALRPSVDPVGHENSEVVLELRKRHLAAVKQMFLNLDVFVFTMGLTEVWTSKVDGTAFPAAPGTICGSFDAGKHQFVNLGYPEIWEDMMQFWRRLKEVNGKARLLLTVSPVPLTATASNGHVLAASTYSKSALRAVAGDLARREADIFYFPSFEIISSHPSRAIFYEPNLRAVNDAGVRYVMDHFFSGPLAREFSDLVESPEDEEVELICDEEAQDKKK